MTRAGAIVAAVTWAVSVWCIIGTTAAAAEPDCSVQFNNLMPCINYVQGTDPAPGAACCTAFHEVQTTYPVCLCELLQQLQNPISGLGNVTRALDISTVCKVPADVSKCATLLGTPVPAPAIMPSPVVAPSLPTATPAPTGAEVNCTASLNDLSPCITYVSTNGTQPPPADCCKALGGVQSTQPVCLCQLLAQPSDAGQHGINTTKAMDLPTVCKVPADFSKCPALLGSPVSSPVGSPMSPSLAPAGALIPVAGGPSSAASGGTPSSVPESSTPNGAASRQLRPMSKEMLLLTVGALVGLEILFLL